MKAFISFLIRYTLVIGVVMCVIPSDAHADEEFLEGNKLYHEGEYAEATEAYGRALANEEIPEAYYNLGNAYFKNGDLGLAILNYERALKLQPRDRDIRSNLAYANRVIEYEIEDNRGWHLRFLSAVLSHTTLTECLVMTQSWYFAFIVTCLVSILIRRRIAVGQLGIILLSLTVVSGVFSLLKYTNVGAGEQAVITEPEVEVRYGPSPSDRLAFRLVEGLKVSVKDEKPEWYRVEMLDGRSGWASRSQVTVI